jgi:predicted GH43/DUF377 family glycosyl hydrolase
MVDGGEVQLRHSGSTMDKDESAYGAGKEGLMVAAVGESTAQIGELFIRSPQNPILVAGAEWWEARGVLNPGATMIGGRVFLVYRAVGADGLSRLGATWSDDGHTFLDRGFLAEASLGDPDGRLGIEDPRLVSLDGAVWLTYTSVSVSPVGVAPLGWEPAPFRLQMRLARVTGSRLEDDRPILKDVLGKDAVLFPRRIGNLYHALLRVYPSILLTTSPDLVTWSAPRVLMEPRPGTWEGERIGAGPPPIETPMGWLMLYHANEFYHARDNRRLYRAGLALLDRNEPSRVLYRHPVPVLEPRAPYEVSGPVGNVVFPTGLIEREGMLLLYYGAADGVIGLATTPAADLYRMLEKAMSSTPHMKGREPARP